MLPITEAQEADNKHFHTLSKICILLQEKLFY